MSETGIPDDLRLLTPAQLIAWVEGGVRTVRLRTFRDAIPGGFMAALAPALIDWQASDPFGTEPHAVLRNVNYGGNPLESTTLLHRVHVPLDGIAFVEFILVPSTPGGLHAPVHHAQLRFVYRPEKRPVLLSLTDSPAGSAVHLPDLVLSWEAWHASSVHYSGITGLDAAAYQLSLRAYAGPQRFLEDTLRQRPWFGYRLYLPGGTSGSTELLKVVLALGDGVARHTLSRLLKQGEETWLHNAPPGEVDAASLAEWQKLRALARKGWEQQDARLRLSTQQQSYQTLVRSCATLARYSILTAANRLIEQGHTGELDVDKLPAPALAEPEEWMKDLAHTNLRGLFERAPLALAYVVRHPESVPEKIPDELATAGLVEARDGRARVVKYTRHGTSPYDRTGNCGADDT